MPENGMNKYDKEYDAFQIFEQIRTQEETVQQPAPSPGRDRISWKEDPFYEIEYDADGGWSGGAGNQGNGSAGQEYVVAPDQIDMPPRDEVRELFNRMRDIARESRHLNFSSSRFYDQRTQQENAKIFYRQGMFMEDFEDSYEKIVPYSSYFPNYQMMGYDQLRTYFTWRTRVRQGDITNISLSYAFLYIYELLNNIGVDSPREGLDKLMFFWEAFREYDKSVDKYVVKWLKDYHVYYGMEESFRAFAEENQLLSQYPALSEEEENFDLYCGLSKYDIRKSSFYTEERQDLVQRCFFHTLERLRSLFLEKSRSLDDLIFVPTRNMAVWTPFQGALFYPAGNLPDRRVVLSRREIYLCSHGYWTFSVMITADSGKRLLAYVMKQMESVLRKLTNFKYRLSANSNILSPVMADELRKAGISLEQAVTDAVKEFYREETRTVVKIHPGALEKIREEAYATQEKLIVPEDMTGDGMPVNICREIPGTEEHREETGKAGAGQGLAQEETSSSVFFQESQPQAGDIWQVLWAALTETERKALQLIQQGGTDLKTFSDERDIMLEVLIDGINEKAVDFVGDSLLDQEAAVYDDYIVQVKGMVEEI